MALSDKLKSFWRGATPAAQLAETEAAIAAAEAERKQHQDRRPAAAVAKLTGDPDAAGRVDAIDQAVTMLDGRLRDLREARDELRRRIAAEEAAARRRVVEDRPRRIAELRAQRFELVKQLEERMGAAAAAMEALEKNGLDLADQLDDGRRFLDPWAFRQRACNAFAAAFAIDRTRSLTAQNNRLGLASTAVGAAARRSIREWEEEALDTVALYFLTRAEAEAKRDELAAAGAAHRSAARAELHRRDTTRATINGTVATEMAEIERQLGAPAPKPAIVELPGGVFTLVAPERVYGDRAAAERAALGEAQQRRRVAVVEHGGAFVLLPQHLAGEAA